mmetsp:Transcript_19936/g.54993  ORF Transcript_19936/g.54993 Transcript_19936/m.54993 type:complete len:240 (+) Transcript_19936:2955-3674(+)
MSVRCPSKQDADRGLQRYCRQRTLFLDLSITPECSSGAPCLLNTFTCGFRGGVVRLRPPRTNQSLNNGRRRSLLPVGMPDHNPPPMRLDQHNPTQLLLVLALCEQSPPPRLQSEQSSLVTPIDLTGVIAAPMRLDHDTSSTLVSVVAHGCCAPPDCLHHGYLSNRFRECLSGPIAAPSGLDHDATSPVSQVGDSCLDHAILRLNGNGRQEMYCVIVRLCDIWSVVVGVGVGSAGHRRRP